MTKKEMAQAAVDAPSACKEFKEAAEAYLAAIGSVDETEKGKILVAEAEEDICTNDGVMGFFSSDRAKGIFGEDKAKAMYEHHKALLESGVKYCDCPACTAAKQIIDNKDLFSTAD